MADQPMDTEEHDLPSIEAVLAGTMALMTGYSQALQAELHPQQRMRMGETIGENLLMLVDHPLLSLGFRQVLLGLRDRWEAMNACTRDAALECGSAGDAHHAYPTEDSASARRADAKHLH